MNSEKVKDIKKALEFQRYSLAYLKDNVVEYVSCKDILTLINELERENEALKEILQKYKISVLTDVGELNNYE